MRRLSPSSVGTWLRCQEQFRIFQEEGHISPPEIALETAKKTHDVILVKDLGSVVRGEARPRENDLLEMYLHSLDVPEVREAPDIDTPDVGGFRKLYDAEAKAMQGFLAASRWWRDRVRPVSVERRLEFQMGAVDVLGFLDLEEPGKVTDLKRRGAKSKAFTPEQTATSLQLIPYAVATGATDVGYVTLKEGDTERTAKEFLLKRVVEAPVTEGAIARVTTIYERVAEAIETGVRVPVDKAGPYGWACQARYCGAWRADARDWVTNEAIACPYGELARVTVAGGNETGE